MKEDKLSETGQRIERTVSEMLTKTRGKANASGGDPFHEYRLKKILPKTLEYGMNCFFDRIVEGQGQEVAQLVYEVFKRIPWSYTICEDTSGYDIEGIPILFLVNSLPFMAAYNIAVLRANYTGVLESRRAQKSAFGFFAGEPECLQRLEDETNHETAWRLHAICGGLDQATLELLKRGRIAESEKAFWYTKAFLQVVPRKVRFSNDEKNKLHIARIALSKALVDRNEIAKLEHFLPQLSPRFWNVLLESTLSKNPDVHAVAEIQAKEKWVKELKESFGKSKENRKELPIGHSMYWECWEKIMFSVVARQLALEMSRPGEKKLRLARNCILEQVAYVFLRVLGYEGSFDQVLQTANRFELEFLFGQLVKELCNPSRMKWYHGKGTTSFYES